MIYPEAEKFWFNAGNLKSPIIGFDPRDAKSSASKSATILENHSSISF